MPRDPKVEIVRPDLQPLSDLRIAVVVDYLGDGLYVQLPIVARHAEIRSQATYPAGNRFVTAGKENPRSRNIKTGGLEGPAPLGYAQA